MTRARQTNLLALLALLAFSLPIFHALLTAAQICTDDLTVHIHEAYALQRLIEGGHLLSRWSPDLAQGYGYPLFNFYAPLSSYPLAFLGLLGIPYPFAAQLTLVLFVWLAGLGMYLCARNLFGPVAALSAAVAYVFAPYLGYDLFFRGAATEVLAWVWIPFCLWGLRLAAQRASWRWAAIAGLSYAALLPSHNLAALLSTPLIGAWAIFTALETKQLSRLRYGLVGLGLGLALSAAFWVPALAERDLVRTDRLLDPPLLQYGTNFIQWDELLASPQIIDPNLANPSPPRALGQLTALFAALGLLVLFNRHSPRSLILLLSLALIGYASFTLKFTEPLWASIPLLKFAQFPWRMLTPAAACAALLAGAAVSAWPRATWPLTGLASAALAVGATGWFTPSYCPPETDLKAGTFAEGSFGYSEYLPATVRTFPDDSLYNQLTKGEIPQRLQTSGTVQLKNSDPLNAAFTLTLPAPGEVLYKQFYFSGWQVRVDGAPVAINLKDDGLLRFNVPSGQHEVQINLAETPLRLTADAVSLLAALILLGLGSRASVILDLPQLPASSTKSWLGLLLLGGLVSIVTLTVKPLTQTRWDGQTVRGAGAVRASFVGGVEVYAASIPRVESGGAFDVKIYAGVRAPIPQRFVPALTVEDDSGLQWSDSTTDFSRWLRPPFTANDWKPGQYALWARRVQLLSGTPPGLYTVWLTVYDADTNVVDSVLGPDGNPAGPRVKLGAVLVTRPISTLTFARSQPLLVGVGTVDRSEARPGDTVLVSIMWHVQQKPASVTRASVELINPENGVVASEPVIPATPNWPLANWQSGDEWRGQYLFRIPANLPNGTYSWGIRLSNDVATIPLGPNLTVTAPQRVFVVPSIPTAVQAQAGDFASLLGYGLSGEAKAGQPLTVMLIWKALATPNSAYSVFVHLSDASGHLWAQNDSAPQNGIRPTSGWLPNEYITDDHVLNLPADLPPGDYTLYVGLADPTTGQRIPVSGAGAQADERIEIGSITVQP